MEGKKEATSSSSFTTDLFGSKKTPSSSSSRLFDSIFPPPATAHRGDYISSEDTKNCDSTTKRDCLDNEGKSQTPKTDMSPFYQQEVSQPCHLSSSIYYGGQDICINPRTTKNTPGHATQYSKDGEDDGFASRGNWWQGSLYY